MMSPVASSGFAQSPCDVEFIRKYGTGIRAHMIHQSGAPAGSDLDAMRYIWEVDDLASLKVGMLILVDFVPPRSEWRVKYISSRTANRICFVGDRYRGWSLDSIVIRLLWKWKSARGYVISGASKDTRSYEGRSMKKRRKRGSFGRLS